jgi:hypothetical protein
MMAIDGSTSSDPKDPFGLGELGALVPYALAFLSNDGSESSYASLKQSVRSWAQNDPFDTLLTVVFGGGVALYLAERETNPACQTPWDGIRFMATVLSVGDATPLLTTPTGRAVATVAQTFGPAVAFAAFQPPAGEKRAAEAEAAAVNRAILARLEDIVRLLEANQ